MNSLYFRGKTIELPGSTAELNSEQYAQISQIRESYMPIPYQKKLIVDILLNLKWYQFFRKAKLALISDYERLELFRLADFVLKNDFYSEFKTEVKIKGCTYAFAQPYMHNSTFIEFIAAENHYQKFRQKTEIADLDRLIAVLCRKKEIGKENRADFDGDVREKFNEQTVNARALLLGKALNLAQKTIILQHFGLTLQKIANLLQANGSTAIGQHKGSWFEVLHTIAEKPQQMQQIGDQNLYLIIFHINQKTKEAKEIDKMYAKH